MSIPILRKNFGKSSKANWKALGQSNYRRKCIMNVRELRRYDGRLWRDWFLSALIVAIISPVMPAQPPKDATAPLLISGTVVDEKGNPVAGATISGVAGESLRRDGHNRSTSV